MTDQRAPGIPGRRSAVKSWGPTRVRVADRRWMLERRARRFDLVRSRHVGVERGRYRRVLSQLRPADAFERHERGDRPGVVRQTSRAARLDPRMLANRGVASILAQAVVGADRFHRVQRLARSVAGSGSERKHGN